MWLKLSIASLVFLMAFTFSLPSFAQDEKKVNADETKSKGRLPAYYKDVVDAKQKEDIYKLQADYFGKISLLQEQIKKLVAERDEAIEKVLSPEQLVKLKKIREEALSKRKSAGLGPAEKASAKSE
jgi:hypothetical protein